MTAPCSLRRALDDEGIEGGLADAPASFITAEPDPAQASVPEPTPDRFRIEAQALSSFLHGQETLGVGHRGSFLFRLHCSRKRVQQEDRGWCMPTIGSTGTLFPELPATIEESPQETIPGPLRGDEPTRVS